MERVGVADSQNLVRAAQRALASQGFNPGPADGRLGHRTHEAIADFQKAHNLPVSGTLDDASLKALNLGASR